MPLPIPLTTKPMEAEPVDELPRGKGWLYEPKYDGFRCLAFRDGDRHRAAVEETEVAEPVLPGGRRRTGQAEGRSLRPRRRTRHPRPVLRDAAAAPASGGKPRRQAGEGIPGTAGRVRPAGRRQRQADRQAAVRAAGGAEGVREGGRPTPGPGAVEGDPLGGDGAALACRGARASTASWPSRSTSPTGPASASCASSRSGTRSTPCWPATTRTRRPETIDSLLFGLYGDDGLLHFVGHSRVYDDAAEIAKLLEPLKGGTGFTGRSPGGKSRWTGKTQKMVRLDPSARRRTQRRPHQRRPVPARLAADPLAHRQGAGGLHDGSAFDAG